MKEPSKQSKVFIGISAIISVFIILIVTLYLAVLPKLVSNQKVISLVEKTVKENIKADLTIQNPTLKTSLSPEISFRVDEIKISKNSKNLFYIKNFDSTIAFSKILNKKITLKKIGLDDFFADTNALLSLIPSQSTTPNKKQQKNDWSFEWLDSLMYIKNCLILYDIDSQTHVKIFGKDIEITDTREPKYVRFNLKIDVLKNNDKVTISLANKDNVFIKNHKLFVDKGILQINNSKILIDAVSDEKANFELNVYSHKFNVKNATELLKTNIVIPNGSEILSYFKDFGGNFDFNIKITNNDLNGIVKIDKATLRVTQLNNLPIVAEKGLVEITKDKIILKDFTGWYGNSKNNSVELFGDVKDYTKSVDTNIEITGLTTNDLLKNYISKVVGCPLTLTGDSKSKIYVKSKYNKIDIIYQGKIENGDDILVDGASLSPVDYDRAFMAEFHIEKNNLDIKSIKYYIAKELTKDSTNVKPILTVDGKMDMATLEIKKLGFNIPNPLPSEFLNVLISQKLFKGGEIAGHMYFVNENKKPKLDGTLTMKKVRIPSQRTSIQKAKFSTNNNSINIDAQGRFKRSQYEFKGDIKNSLLFPIVIKDISLNIDNIDIDKILSSMNNQNTSEVNSLSTAQTIQNEQKTFVTSTKSDDENDEQADNAYTFDTGLLIVEKCALVINKGFYKELNFGNLIANLTLNKNGILEIKSNRFDFADGISTLKVFCDLKNHIYKIRLGVKDVNSDKIATTLLALPREISGKAMGLIELNTDKTLKLNGRIQFDIQNGSIQKVGLLEYVLNFAALFRNPMAMISPSTIFDLVNIPDGNFDKINGDLVIKNNVIEKIMIKSAATQLSSFIIGRYDIETKDAMLRIYTKFSNKRQGFGGFLRNFSLNALANKMNFNQNETSYYASELAQLPPIQADEKDCQVFLTKVDGDVENFNFLSSLKKIK